MRSRQSTVLSVLRGIKTATVTILSAKGRDNKPLTDDEQISIIRKQVAQRADSIKCFHEAGRLELALAEEREKAILESFLPVELDAFEVEKLVEQALSDTASVTKKDMGRAITRAKELAAGRVDPRVLSHLISIKLI